MSEKKILFLTTGNNQVHLDLVSSLDNVTTYQSYSANKQMNIAEKTIGVAKGVVNIPSGYDIIICESSYYYPALRKMFGLLPKNTKIINMNTSVLLYNMLNRKINKAEDRLLRHLLSFNDGYISIGEYGKEILEKLGEKKQCIVAYPTLEKDFFDRFSNVKPDPKNRDIAIIIRKDAYMKGLDIAIDALGIINKKYPETKLHVLGTFFTGKNISNRLNNPNVILHGWVNDMGSILEKCLVYIHPGRGEPFGMVVLESMCAGLIPVVSTDTGTKEFVEKVDDQNVVPLSAHAFADRIMELFSIPEKQLESMSMLSRNVVADFFKKDFRKKFRDDFYKMIKDIDSHEE